MRGSQRSTRWLRWSARLAMTLGGVLYQPCLAAALCTGDCNRDGVVTIDELLTMVNVALGNVSVTACEIGDLNHDSLITVDEILTGVDNTLAGCPPPIFLRISSPQGAPGQRVSFWVTVDTAGQRIAATQNKITFNPSARIASTENGEPDCTGAGSATVFLPIGCAVHDCGAVRATFAMDPIPNGTVAYTCNVNISAGAAVGSRLPLTCSAATFVDDNIEQFPAGCDDGEVVVTSP